MMAGVEAELLRLRDLVIYHNPDGPTFEQLVARGRKKGLSDDEVFERIVKNASRSNRHINRWLGLD